MVWASAGNLPEQNKSNECVNRPPGTAVKKYAGTHDLPCTAGRRGGAVHLDGAGGCADRFPGGRPSGEGRGGRQLRGEKSGGQSAAVTYVNRPRTAYAVSCSRDRNG